MKTLITLIPYITIALANFLYLYFYSFDPIEEWYLIVLFNFVLMLLIGAFLIINLNILLYKWIHDEREFDEKGKPTKKQMFKKQIKKLL